MSGTILILNCSIHRSRCAYVTGHFFAEYGLIHKAIARCNSLLACKIATKEQIGVMNAPIFLFTANFEIVPTFWFQYC